MAKRVKATLTGLAAVTGPAGLAWYRGETLEVDGRQLGLLMAQHGDVFVVQGEPATGEAAPQPLAFGTAGDVVSEPAMAADVAAGKRKK